jgi:hypothetical protein
MLKALWQSFKLKPKFKAHVGGRNFFNFYCPDCNKIHKNVGASGYPGSNERVICPDKKRYMHYIAPHCRSADRVWLEA